MKKHILFLAVSLLLAVPSFAQNDLAMLVDQHVGIGLGGASPTVFGNTSYVVQYTFGYYFQLGAGVGLRYGLTTRSYDPATKDKKNSFELDLPIFLRLGVKYSIISLKVDAGYAVGLKAWAWGITEGVNRDLHFNGFFVEPHIDLGGDRNSVGVGILLQTGHYLETQSNTEGAAAGINVSKLLPAITLRYSHYF